MLYNLLVVNYIEGERKMCWRMSPEFWTQESRLIEGLCNHWINSQYN